MTTGRELSELLRAQGIRDERVLAAIERVPRDRFVPPVHRKEAWADTPLPIGHAQTISQPYVVAYMTEAARLREGANVLEVGTGSGYQAAILADVLGLRPGGEDRGARLASIEIVRPLAEQARSVLEELGYRIDLRLGDAFAGWPERAPFDAIVVTAAPPRVPQPLIDQLAPGGRLVIPVGELAQDLQVVTRTAEGVTTQSLLPVRFVPMTGEAQRK
jgi:protein-L-isoaspartate(D-aspartate) O-methyltransferase